MHLDGKYDKPMVEIVVGILGILVALAIAVVRIRSKKQTNIEQELRDAENANDILTKSITRKPERVQRLDKAGYRD